MGRGRIAIPSWRRVRPIFAILVVVFGLAALSGLGPLKVHGATQGSPLCENHELIVINGNADFTRANGVTGGIGTSSDPYVIEGWCFEAGQWSNPAIHISNTDAHLVIRWVRTTGIGYIDYQFPTWCGICLSMVENATVENNTLENSLIDITSWGDTAVIGNNLTFNQTAMGIRTSSAAGTALIKGNELTSALLEADGRTSVIEGNRAFGSRPSGIEAYGRAIITNNSVHDLTISGGRNWTVVGNEFGHISSRYNTFITIDFNHVGGPLTSGYPSPLIDVQDSQGVSIKGNQLSEGLGIGVRISHSANITMLSNIIDGSARQGLYLESSNNVTVRNNTIKNNGGDGILLAQPMGGNPIRPTNITVANSSIQGNVGYGLRQEPVPYPLLVIRGNTMKSNTDGGIRLEDASDAIVESNDVEGNNNVGVFLKGHRGFATGNRVSHHHYGIYIFSLGEGVVARNVVLLNGFGIYLDSSTSIIVYHNNLDSNGVQANDTGGAVNSWDAGYPRGGNYWTDYTGVDMCGGPEQNLCTGPDGLGDTPYIIDQDSRDRYPLMVAPSSKNTPTTPAFQVSPASGNTLTTFTVNASSTSDIEDPPRALFVHWDWEDDGLWDTDFSATRTAQHNYPKEGSYTIRLEVMDPGGLTASTTATIHVSSPSPLNVVISPQSAAGVLPLQVVFQVDATGGVPPYTYLWSFGDGSSGTEKNPVHVYETSGWFTVMVTVTDATGSQVEGSATIHVLVTSEVSGHDGPGLPFPLNQGILFGAIGGVVLTGVLVVLLRRRRRSR